MAAYHNRLNLKPSKGALQAAVLILLYPDDDQISTVFIERPHHDRDRHSGQIAFPGGRIEPSDDSLEAGALREAEEEIGLDPTTVQVVGRLTDLFIPVSNYLVAPVIGVTYLKPVFIPQIEEVANILPTSLQHFTQPEIRKRKDLTIRQGLMLRQVPYFDVHGKTLWGATAMIFNEFLEIIKPFSKSR